MTTAGTLQTVAGSTGPRHGAAGAASGDAGPSEATDPAPLPAVPASRARRAFPGTCCRPATSTGTARSTSWTPPSASSRRWPGGRSASCPTLRGRTVVNLFYEDSTRTRISFELAAKRLSADVINFSAKGSSVSKGESLKDTALTLQAMGADAVVCRHWASGAPAAAGHLGGRKRGQRRGRHPRAPDPGAAGRLHPATAPRGTRSEPTSPGGGSSSSATCCTPGSPGPTCCCCPPSAREVTLVAPPTLLPVGVDDWPAEVSYDLDAALAGADAVMMLRVQRERMGGAFFPTAREYSRCYGLDARRRALIAPHGVVMHPGPDEPRHGDQPGRRGRRRVGDRGTGGERGHGPDGGALPAALGRGEANDRRFNASSAC